MESRRRFVIELVREAEADLDATKPFHRKRILDEIESRLLYAPKQTSRSRIKRLRTIESPAYRLRAGDYRVYYDVDETKRTVTILRVLSKEQSLSYLEGR